MLGALVPDQEVNLGDVWVGVAAGAKCQEVQSEQTQSPTRHPVPTRLKPGASCVGWENKPRTDLPAGRTRATLLSSHDLWVLQMRSY